MPIPESNSYTPAFQAIKRSLEFLQETKEIDFKHATEWQHLKEGLVKDAIAMSNNIDGGWIIVGVREAEPHWEIPGITHEHLRTYNPDLVSSYLANHIDPAPVLRMFVHSVKADCNVLAIRIEPCTGMISIAKQSVKKVMPGQIFVRKESPASSSPVVSQEDLKPIFDQAVDTSVRNMLGRMKVWGLPFKQGAALPSDDDNYDTELGGA